MITMKLMTKRMKTRTIQFNFIFCKVTVLTVLFSLLIAPINRSYALDTQLENQTVTPKSDVITRKLKRGFHNLFLGWIEIPQGVESIGSQHGVGAAATLGVLHGAGRAVQRTATGLFDILTFPLDTGDGYGAMIESEFDREKNQPSSQIKTNS